MARASSLWLPKTGSRSVPIPPALVAERSAWVHDLEPEPDELLFRTRTGKMPTLSNWLRAWHRCLAEIDHAPLRLYDSRHAAATKSKRSTPPATNSTPTRSDRGCDASTTRSTTASWATAAPCQRPAQLDCSFESICESCVHFTTDATFQPVVLCQRDHAAANDQTRRAELLNNLLAQIGDTE